VRTRRRAAIRTVSVSCSITSSPVSTRVQAASVEELRGRPRSAPAHAAPASDGLTCRFRSCGHRRSIAADPDERYLDAAELLDALGTFEVARAQSSGRLAAGPHRHRDRGGAAGDRNYSRPPISTFCSSGPISPISPTTPSAAHSSRGRSPSSRPPSCWSLTLLGGALLHRRSTHCRGVVSVGAQASINVFASPAPGSRTGFDLTKCTVGLDALALSAGSWSLSGGISVRFCGVVHPGFDR